MKSVFGFLATTLAQETAAYRWKEKKPTWRGWAKTGSTWRLKWTA